MKKISNNKAKDYTTEKIPFRGSNLHGTFIQDKYVVYSYGEHFPLFVCKDDIWYFNTTRYSNTTTRHFQNARPNIDFGQVVEVNLQEILKIAFN